MKFIPAKDPNTFPSDSRRVLVAVKRTNRVVTLIGRYYRKGELVETPLSARSISGGWYSEMCDNCEMSDTLEYQGSAVVGWAELPVFDVEGKRRNET